VFVEENDLPEPDTLTQGRIPFNNLVWFVF